MTSQYNDLRGRLKAYMEKMHGPRAWDDYYGSKLEAAIVYFIDEELQRYLLPDGQPDCESILLVNCLRLLNKEAQGRLIRNLIERGAEYTPVPILDSINEVQCSTTVSH